MTLFETERLILRKFTLDDVHPSWEMDQDPLVNRYTGEESGRSLDFMQDIITNRVMADYAKHGYGRLAVVHKADNRFIGFAGLKFVEELQQTDLGYRLLPPYWGQGLATEACRPVVEYGFQKLNLPEIVALVMPGNAASTRVLDKLGFEQGEDMVLDGDRCLYYSLKASVLIPKKGN